MTNIHYFANKWGSHPFPLYRGQRHCVITARMRIFQTLSKDVTIYTTVWREAISVKCLAQGHEYQGCGQDSNPHSDDSAMRTMTHQRPPQWRLSHHILYKFLSTLLKKIKGTWSAPSLVCGHSQVQLLEDMHNCISLKSVMFKKQLTLLAMSLTQLWHLFKG